VREDGRFCRGGMPAEVQALRTTVSEAEKSAARDAGYGQDMQGEGQGEDDKAMA